MPRPARQTAPEIFHHVVARGVGQMSLFLDDADCAAFVERMKRIFDEEHVECAVWALMVNHFHLLVRPMQTGISRAMARLGTSYAKYFNRRYQRAGHVFQNRFFSKLCQDDRYLRTATRYILLNPVKAGLAKDAAGWPWTNFAELVGPKSRQGAGARFIMALLGESGDPVKEFLDLVDARHVDDLPSIGQLIEDWNVIPLDEATFETIFLPICSEFGVSRQEIVSRSKRAEVVAARETFLRQAWNRGYRDKDLVDGLGFRYSTLSMIRKRIGDG